jgi:putative hemolysin
MSCGTLFFSVNAMALRTFSRVKLQEAFKSSGKHVKPENLTNLLSTNHESLILTCYLFRLIFNMSILLLVLSLFGKLHGGTPLITDYLLTFVVSLVIFSIFSLAIPHAWAKYAGETVLSRSYHFLLFFVIIASPFLYALRAWDGLVRRLTGVPLTSPDQEQEEKQEEFLNGLEQRRIEGVVDEEEQEMIENVLELSETTADEIMTPRTDIVAVDISSDLNKLLETINNAGHTRLPVCESNIDNIVGLIYAKDLLVEVGRDPAGFKLKDKIRDAYFVPETKPLRTLLHEFQNQKLHIAIVLDEYGGTAGVVTLEDILEELVGEITDEYEKTPAKGVKKIDANTFDVNARTYVDDLNDDFDLNLPGDEDYDTVGGFVFSHLGYIPKTGETFKYNNLDFTIVAAETRRIRRIRIKRNAESEN